MVPYGALSTIVVAFLAIEFIWRKVAHSAANGDTFLFHYIRFKYSLASILSEWTHQNKCGFYPQSTSGSRLLWFVLGNNGNQ